MAKAPGHGQDTERFVRLLADSQREVLRYILALVPDVHDAHEILQDTAVDLWKKFDQYDPAHPFIPWACRFAFRRVLKYREQRVRRGKCLSLDVMDLLAAQRLQEDDILEERRRALAACLKRLSDAERFLVEERYTRRATVAEMAEAAGQNASTIYKALERVRRRLFECINRRVGWEGLP